MVKEVFFAVPGDLGTPTGGYTYDRRIVAELPALGWRPEVVNLGDGFPCPTAETRARACARLSALAHGRPLVIDGLAFGALPDAAHGLRPRHPLVALVHHPLALESGLSAAESAALRASERVALACARHVVATSARVARLLVDDYGVTPEGMSVVQPGTDRVPARPRNENSVVKLLAVGSLIPRKGYDVLVAALARLSHLPWRLTVVGDCGRSPQTARQVRADIARLGLADQVTLLGTVGADELAPLYASADLFVLPSRFEGYGMAYAEAIAHGVPVVGTTAGAIPETVPADAGVLVAPDNVEAFAAALQRLIANAGERERLAAGARAASFPSWREQAMLFARVLDRLA
ncbi:MAG TPA: glycosyltransferase family 4 protein [Xanthobacteraceae bacterium]|nr:glycosyltransferase family 4 protein [Xanthobacteraceae bacterium]